MPSRPRRRRPEPAAQPDQELLVSVTGLTQALHAVDKDITRIERAAREAGDTAALESTRRMHGNVANMLAILLEADLIS